MAAMLALMGQKKLVKKNDFECPVCIELDPYRDEPACAQCEKHHDLMRLGQARVRDLDRSLQEHILERSVTAALVAQHTGDLESYEVKLKMELKMAKLVYAGWGALAATVLCSLIYM